MAKKVKKKTTRKTAKLAKASASRKRAAAKPRAAKKTAAKKATAKKAKTTKRKVAKSAAKSKRTSTKKTSAAKTRVKKTITKKTTTKKTRGKRAGTASSVKKRPTSSGRKPTSSKQAARPTRTKPARKEATVARASSPVEVAAPAKRTRVRRLTQSDLALFRELLIAKRAELSGDLQTMQDEALSRNRQDRAGDLSSMPIHMADIGTDNYEQEFTLGLLEGERALLRDIYAALERIDRGTYGICAATGRPISKARLKARPWAKYCYEYVLAQESGQHRGI